MRLSCPVAPRHKPATARALERIFAPGPMRRAARLLSPWGAGGRLHACEAQLDHARRCSHAAASSSAGASDPGFLVTLERSVGSGGGAADALLIATGAFQAEVFPDLPVATTWAGLGKALLG